MEINGAIRQTAVAPDLARTARPPEPAGRSGVSSAAGASAGAPPDVVKSVANEVAASVPNGSRLYVDKATNRVVLEILNDQNEVVKQIPAEALLRAIAQSREVTGLILDKRT